MNRGITLIEIAVTVAIVVILSAVVLAALNDMPRQVHSTSIGESVPAPSNYVVDTTKTLTAEQMDTLNVRLGLAAANGKEVAVLIVPSTLPSSIEEYGIRVAENWKVGDDQKDNGVILIIAKEDRKIRIEVGYGAEADITDADAGILVRDTIAPFLREGDWYGGVSAGIDGILMNLK